MILLGIETSCDETALSIVENGTAVRSNIISSSRKQFEDLGGVVPEEAARAQIEYILPTLHKALKESNVSMEEIDAIAVTSGPGLLGSLLVGTSAAKTLASLWKKPLIGVHHTLGHLSSTWLDAEVKPEFPLLALSVSGGHTELWYRKSHTENVLLGSTKDDAAGEAFDKGAVQLGLPYPGGPAIAKTAESGSADSYAFPRPLQGKDGCDFSFSGLKTALKYLLRDLEISSPNELDPTTLSNIAASYEHAICEHLCSRIKIAIELHPEVKEVHIVGGVSANTHLRNLVTDALEIPVRYPVSLHYCTDNGAMIAAAGYFLQEELGEKAYEPFRTTATIKMHSA